MTAPSIVPELAVRDWSVSRRFYCDTLDFQAAYERPEEGFSYLTKEGAALMIDQIGLGRSFDDGHLPTEYPAGKGVNLQIRVASVTDLLDRLEAANVPLYLALEDKWYRRGAEEVGNRQFVVADPDGYLLRFFQALGVRPAD